MVDWTELHFIRVGWSMSLDMEPLWAWVSCEGRKGQTILSQADEPNMPPLHVKRRAQT